MKFKPSIWTIVLIILSLYLIVEAVSWYNLKQDKWNECEEISNDRTRLSPLNFSLNDNSLENKYAFAEWYNSADDYGNCLENYTDAWIWYDIRKYLALTFIVLSILSWRIDNKK
jgi:hypothetical protein